MRILIYLLFLSSFIFADVAKISAIVGDAVVLRDGKKIKITLGKTLKKQDTISTSNNSKLQIIFEDNTIVTLGKNSSLNIKEYVYDTKTPSNSKTDLNFFKGAFKAITGNIGKLNKDKFKLRTKAASIGIRGTTILANQKQIACTSGEIIVSANGISVSVPKNSFTTTVEGTAPTEAKEMTTDVLNILEDSLLVQGTETTTQGDDEKSSEIVSSENSDDTTTIVSSSEELTTSTVESSTSTTKSDDVEETSRYFTNYDLEGHYFGANFTSSSKVTFEDDSFEGKRKRKVVSFDNDFSRSDGVAINVKGEKKFPDVTSGRYDYKEFDLTNASLIPFSFSSLSLSGNYSVYTDNVGEVFIGFNYTKDNVTSDSSSFLFILGNETDSSKLKKDKIYIYKDFKEIKVGKDSSSTIVSNDYSEDVGHVFYNHENGSFTHIKKEFYKTGAKEITIGKKDSAKSYYNDYTFSYATPYTLSKIKTSQTDAEIEFLGSQYQSLYYDLDTSSKTTNFSPDSEVTSTQETLGVSVLQNKDTSVKTSGSYTLDGFMSGKSYGSSHQVTDTQIALNLNIDRDNKTIKTTNTIELKTNADITIDSSLENDTAFYVTDDLFGAMFDSSSTYLNSSDTYTLVSNSGYMFSVPDGKITNTDTGEHKIYDDSDNPLMSDDESSWGYWTANFEKASDNIFIDTQSTWVAGTTTAVDEVDSLIKATNLKKFFFKGKVLGNVVLDGTTSEAIKVDDTNSVSLVFNLGGGIKSMEGSTMKFETETTQWDLGLNSTTVEKDGFSGSFTGGTGSYSGKYYGTGEVKSVGGSFNVSQTVDSKTNVATGVFKAAKWKEE